MSTKMLFPFQTNQCRGSSFFSAGNGKRNYCAIDLFEGDPDKGCKVTYGRSALDNAEVLAGLSLILLLTILIYDLSANCAVNCICMTTTSFSQPVVGAWCAMCWATEESRDVVRGQSKAERTGAPLRHL